MLSHVNNSSKPCSYTTCAGDIQAVHLPTAPTITASGAHSNRTAHMLSYVAATPAALQCLVLIVMLKANACPE
jgi:hypothetical protein